MLVHKKSLGALEWVWEGEYQTVFGVRMPLMRRVTTAQALGLDPEEWWEVADPVICKQIRRSYPDFEPVCDGAGELVGIRLMMAEEAPVEVQKAPAKRRRNYRKSAWEVTRGNE